MRQTMIAAALAGTSMNAIGQFLNPFLARNFLLGPAEVGRLLGLIAGVSMASGLLLGGFGVDWAGRFDRRWSVWGPALGLVLAAPLFIFGFTRGSLQTTVIILICAHVSMFVFYSPTLAIAQNMVGANMRASSAFVMSGLVLGLVGIGVGPTLVGFLSDRFATHAFAAYLGSCPGGRAPPGRCRRWPMPAAVPGPRHPPGPDGHGAAVRLVGGALRAGLAHPAAGPRHPLRRAADPAAPGCARVGRSAGHAAGAGGAGQRRG